MSFGCRLDELFMTTKVFALFFGSEGEFEGRRRHNKYGETPVLFRLMFLMLFIYTHTHGQVRDSSFYERGNSIFICGNLVYFVFYFFLLISL